MPDAFAGWNGVAFAAPASAMLTILKRPFLSRPSSAKRRSTSHCSFQIFAALGSKLNLGSASREFTIMRNLHGDFYCEGEIPFLPLPVKNKKRRVIWLSVDRPAGCR